MEPAENRCCHDSVPLGQQVIVRSGDPIRQRIRNARSQARVRTAAVVVNDPPLKDPSKMPLIERNHEIQAFAPHRPHQAFAKRVRLRCAYRRSENRQTHRRQRSIDAIRIDAVAIGNHVSMRLIPRHDHSELLRRPVRGGMAPSRSSARFVARPPPTPRRRTRSGTWH